MSRIVKFFIIFVCFIITAQFASLSYLIFVPNALADAPTPPDIRDKVIIPLGSYNDLGAAQWVDCKYQPTTADPSGQKTKCWQIPWLAKYIGNMYKYGLVIGSILAVMMIMIGGIMYMVGGLNPSMISRGKEFIVGAVTGLVLLLGSYVLLKTINPNLVELQPIEVEIIKEAKITMVNLCSELDAAKYVFDGDMSCGNKVKFKAKDPGVDDSGECIGAVCPETVPKKSCVPVNAKDLNAGYACRSVLVWGTVSDPEERYVDAVGLYAVTGNKIVKEVYYSSKEDRGDKAYYIYRGVLTPEDINVLNSYDAVLLFEVNDTGYEREQITYGSGGAGFITKMTNFLHMEGTTDDEYFAGRDPKVPLGNSYVGIWINPKCKTCAAVRPTKPGAKPNEGDGWITDASCAYFSGSQMVVQGDVRIDFNSYNFREDSEIDCKIMEQLNPAGPQLPSLGQAAAAGGKSNCGENGQCASNDCEAEDVGSNVIKNCECKNDADCDPGQTCKTSWATWNQCVTCKMIGEPDGGDSANCCSNDSTGGVCGCNSALDCPEGETCRKEGDEPYMCVPGKKAATLAKDGDLCENDWECISNDCEEESSGWYGAGTEEKRCECNKGDQKLSCGKGKMCVEVENGCGWNYCIPDQAAVPSVPQNYNPFNDPQQLFKGYGLCDSSSECIDNNCKTDWGIHNCNACKK